MLNKVLIVDDSKLVHGMYRQMLKEYDCEFADAMNGIEALELLETEEEIDLILLDIDMPLLDGLGFLERLKQDDRRKSTPVIVISTLGKEADIKRGLELGASAYIIKPFEPGGLYSLIERLCGVSPPQSG